MAFSNESEMGIIYEAQTLEYPDGLAYLVVKQLMDQYKLTDTMFRVEMPQKLNKIKMKRNKNSKKLFE